MESPRTEVLKSSPASGKVEEFRNLPFSFVAGMAVIAAIAVGGEMLVRVAAPYVAIPPMVSALVLGMMFSRIGSCAWAQPAIAFSLKRLLRYAIALLGLRVAFGDIVELGWPTALVIVIAMIVTIWSGLLFARLLGHDTRYGTLIGASTAICGASAALATSSVLPSYPSKARDTAFVVIAVNALSTLAMVAYPPLLHILGFDDQIIGIILGGTIHDVAQVVGAGYSVSETAGNTAVIVKLFRVILLFPIVVAIGFMFAQKSSGVDASKIPVPLFALGFIIFAAINSAMPLIPSLQPLYEPLRHVLMQLSYWGMMLAIAALGLGTTFSAIQSVGWQRILMAIGTTLVILVAVLIGMALIV